MARLRVSECRLFIQAVAEKAEEMGVHVSVAIVGPEGHLIALERMDEAGWITPRRRPWPRPSPWRPSAP